MSDWSSDVCSSDLDFAIAPESAAATVEQPQYPVRIGGAVAQEAAVVLGQAREAIARCARETGGAFGFDRLAQAFVDAFVRVQAQHPVMPALFDRELLLAAEAVDRPLQLACAQAFAQLASAGEGARIDPPESGQTQAG